MRAGGVGSTQPVHTFPVQVALPHSPCSRQLAPPLFFWAHTPDVIGAVAVQ